ncbi:hypothetical protein [uncultured Shewanella sp.]|uniref:hypothetical protein n=1 Tax=uncultured Shewanella sp. TaxID=173975 RepID=UPI0026021106|nr:hypothetical protein [uncultured Shewanella sp.]
MIWADNYGDNYNYNYNYGDLYCGKRDESGASYTYLGYQLKFQVSKPILTARLSNETSTF